jgi:hypothetical protein
MTGVFNDRLNRTSEYALLRISTFTSLVTQSFGLDVTLHLWLRTQHVGWSVQIPQQRQLLLESGGFCTMFRWVYMSMLLDFSHNYKMRSGCELVRPDTWTPVLGFPFVSSSNLGEEEEVRRQELLGPQTAPLGYYFPVSTSVCFEISHNKN